MTTCSGIAGRLFGYKYQARHSVSKRKARPYLPDDFIRVTGTAVESMAKTPRDFEKHTYHGDVCARCGDIVNRITGTEA